MWKQRAAILCGCFGVLPLLMGCANGGQPQAYAVSPPPPAAMSDNAGARVYGVAPSGPATAILVMLPGPGDMLNADPLLWAPPGFDVVSPRSPEIYQLAAAQQAAAARLIAQARAIADAPIWLIGADPASAAAMASMPPAGGQVSGLVVASTSSGLGACTERMIYDYSGDGAPPKVAVSKSGNDCPSGAPFGVRANTTMAPPSMPMVRPRGPHLIEASARSAEAPTARPAVAQRIAELSKSAPQS